MKKLFLCGLFSISSLWGIVLKSPDFKNNNFIPKKFTGEGINIAPRLRWDFPHPHVRSFALICEDPDAQDEPWVHWIIYNIPNVYRILENINPTMDIACNGTMHGLNSWGQLGYNGPMPPEGSGVHHYRFTLYVLNKKKLDLKPGATKQELLKAMDGHILQQVELVGLYERK